MAVQCDDAAMAVQCDDAAPTGAPEPQFCAGDLVWYYAADDEMMWPGQVKTRNDLWRVFNVHVPGYPKYAHVGQKSGKRRRRHLTLCCIRLVWLCAGVDGGPSVDVAFSNKVWPYRCRRLEELWAALRESAGKLADGVDRLRQKVELLESEPANASAGQPPSTPAAGAPSAKRPRKSLDGRPHPSADTVTVTPAKPMPTARRGRGRGRGGRTAGAPNDAAASGSPSATAASSDDSGGEGMPPPPPAPPPAAAQTLAVLESPAEAAGPERIRLPGMANLVPAINVADGTRFDLLLGPSIQRLNRALRLRYDLTRLLRKHTHGPGEQGPPVLVDVTLETISTVLFVLQPWDTPATEQERFDTISRYIDGELRKHAAEIARLAREDLCSLAAAIVDKVGN